MSGQQVIDTNGNEEVKAEEKMLNMEGPKRQFFYFLKKYGFERYFDKFDQHECSDIREIEYLLNDDNFLKTEIGLKDAARRNNFVKECRKMKNAMDELKSSNIIPSMLLKRLAKSGIVSMDILCTEIQNKSELQSKLNINNANQFELLWNIIDKQSDKNVHQSEGNFEQTAYL